MANIKGRKGGGGNPRTPVESPDSLHSIATAKILLGLGEGEFADGITAKDIFLDGTPKESVDGTVNFPDVTWEFRSGTQMQDYIPGMPAVENEITINTALKATQPWTRAISNTQLSAVRVRIAVPALQQQFDNGDVAGYRVDYKIELSVDGGGYSTVLTSAFDGKTTSLYERSHRIDLPKASTGWQIRVSRSTPDSTSSRIADVTNIAAYSEIIDAKLRYPNTALLFVTFDAKQFNNIPQISVKARGRIIRVPSNYDPVSRTYSGTWDGSFKWAYSNNPAWVYYDVLLNERFGLGDRISSSQVDKWELYRIAQYCDQLVPDGRGGNGTEPRFLCDVYIQSQEEAFTVLRDLASIFRGMTYWSNNQVVAIADMPEANDERNYIYTRANVIDGKFIYSSGSERDRYSTAIVSFSDPDNHYSDEPEPVFEGDLVRRYGVRQTSISAIGCTRRTEANRRGRWMLLTNAKDRLITFNSGLDGYIPQPGRIIYVADQGLSGRIMGGRVSSVNGRIITLDRIPDAVTGDRLLVNLPSGKSEARTIQAVNEKLVTVSTAWSVTPEPEAVWSVDAKDVAIQQYRVTSVKDNDDNTFTISGVYHNPDKYAAIDSGARLDERPISAIPPGVQGPPADVSITSYSRVVQGLNVETMRVSWLAPDNAIAYECQWRKDNGDWVSMPRTSSLGFEVEGIYSGRYLARVSAINASDIGSVWKTSAEVGMTGKVGNPPKPVGLTASENVVFGIELSWGFSANTGDTLKTEIQYSATGKNEDLILLADIPYPQHNYQQIGLKGGQAFWYRARLVDRLGNQSEWTEMIRGIASTDASDILDYLKGQIDGTHLGQELSGKLGSISENQEALSRATIEARLQLEKTQQELDQKTASLSTDIGGVQENLNQAEKQLQSSVDQLNEKSVELSGDIDGVRNDLIKAEDRIQSSVSELDEAAYKTSQAIDSINRAGIEAQLQLSQTQKDLSVSSEKLSNDISDVRENLELAEAVLQEKIDAVTGGSDQDIATVISQIEIIDGEQKKQASKVDAVIAQSDGNVAAIQREELARSDGDTALGKRIDVVKAETEDSAAKIVTLIDAQAGLESSQASLSQSLEATNRAQLENALKQEGDVQTQREISARLTTSQQVLTDDQQALGRQITQIDTKYGDTTAQLQEETKALSSENKALSGQFTALSAEVDNNAATARDQTQAVATDLDAEVKRVTALKADVEGNTSSIQREELARSDGDTALGKRIDVVKAETEDSAAKIVTLTDAQAGLESSQASLSQSLEATNRAQLENALKQEGDVQTQREISARLTTSQQLLTDDQQALGRQITQIDTKYGDTTAQLQEETKALSSENKALSGQFTALSAEVDNNAATARDQTQAVATDLDAEVKRVMALKADVEGNTSSIQLEELARSDGDTALGKRIDVVKAETEDSAAKIVTLTDAQAGLESSQASLSQSLEATNRAQLENALKQEGDVQTQREISARLTTSQQVLTDDQQALGRQITQIDTKYGDATAQLQEETKALATESEALSGRFTSLDARVDNNAATARDQTQAVATDLDAEVKRVTALKVDVEDNTSSIQREEQVRSDGDTALGKRIDVVKASTDEAAAAITQIQSVQSDLQGSSASSQTSLEALARADLEGALKQQEDTLSQNASVARIDTKQEVQATEMIALARDITVVSAEVEGTQALVQQNMESVVELDGKISASWSVRVEVDRDGNPIFAGLGLGLDGEGNSQFLIYANRMAMISEANGQQYSPWAVENGEVFFNTALFKKASIDFGIITDTLQSDGFISGVNGRGWSLPKSGNAELNNATVRGHIEALSGTFRGTVYAKDGRFEGTVYADKIEGDVVVCGVWDQVLIYGVNDSATRRFTGGLPYESVLVIPFLQVASSNWANSGRCWVEINGTIIFEGRPGSSGSFSNSVVFHLPPNTAAEVKFVITGSGGGVAFGTPGPITALVFKKSENRFTS